MSKDTLIENQKMKILPADTKLVDLINDPKLQMIMGNWMDLARDKEKNRKKISQMNFTRIRNGKKKIDRDRLMLVEGDTGIYEFSLIASFVHKKLLEENLISPEFTTNPWGVIMSLPGCQQQEVHTDYNVKAVQPTKERTVIPQAVAVSLSKVVLVGLMDWCKIDRIITHPHILGPALFGLGEIVVCDGDFFHAGSAYDYPNLRMNLYFDHPDAKRDPRYNSWVKDQTGYSTMDEGKTERIVNLMSGAGIFNILKKKRPRDEKGKFLKKLRG